jgi:hypothetical protein
MIRVGKTVLIGLAFGLALLGPGFDSPAAAQKTPSVREIVHRANLATYFQGRDGRSLVSMEIKDRQGRVRKRQMTILRRDEPKTDGLENNAYLGQQRYYVYFHRPADVRKMALIVWKNQNRDDSRWLYLPALDLVKRIAASDKRTSFVGSDFFYEDVTGRNIDDDKHALLRVTANYYVVRNRPKKPGSVEFSYFDMFIHKGTFLPVQVEYYDKSGAKYRVYKALEVRSVQGRPTVTKASMRDLRTGSTTTVRYTNVRYDLGLPVNIFSERFLRRAPTKYLR